MSGTKFSSLRIEGWRQFGHVDIALHPRLTVLTGANGAGKSSLLRIFQRHFGINQPFLATPILQSDGGYSYLTGLFTDTIAKIWRRFWTLRSDMSNVGAIGYDNGVESELQIPTQSSVQYNIEIPQQQSVPGTYRLATATTTKSIKEVILAIHRLPHERVNHCDGYVRRGKYSSTSRVKIPYGVNPLSSRDSTCCAVREIGTGKLQVSWRA